jgi:hypothetical protein
MLIERCCKRRLLRRIGSGRQTGRMDEAYRARAKCRHRLSQERRRVRRERGIRQGNSNNRSGGWIPWLDHKWRPQIEVPVAGVVHQQVIIRCAEVVSGADDLNARTDSGIRSEVDPAERAIGGDPPFVQVPVTLISYDQFGLGRIAVKMTDGDEFDIPWGGAEVDPYGLPITIDVPFKGGCYLMDLQGPSPAPAIRCGRLAGPSACQKCQSRRVACQPSSALRVWRSFP